MRIFGECYRFLFYNSQCDASNCYWGVLLLPCYASDIMQGSTKREIVKKKKKSSICTCVGLGGWGSEVGYVPVYVSKPLSPAESLDTSLSSTASRL